MTHEITKALVKNILENPFERKWTLQGLGMLRTYITEELRLHVWDSRYRVLGVTILHDHPWHFDSYIVAGRVEQYRYRKTGRGWAERYNEQSIICGPGGGTCESPHPVYLYKAPLEVYVEGDKYRQEANEIHESLPEDGTVTIIKRTFLDDTETAHVYYPEFGEWVSAEPREAAWGEVVTICQTSLNRWFG